MKQTFPKQEKLKSRKVIQLLFEEGQSYSKYPVKVLYLKKTDVASTQATFAVPKRNFKSAVSRNQVKRLLREAYRLQKPITINNNGKKFVLLFLYIGKDIVSYKKIETSIRVLLKKVYSETAKH